MALPRKRIGSSKKSIRSTKTSHSLKTKKSPALRFQKASFDPGTKANVWAIFLLGFLLIAAGILSFSNFQFQVPDRPIFHLLLQNYLAVLGFVTLIAAFRLVPESQNSFDISRRAGVIWFSFFFALTFYARFSHPETPEATFWYDDLVVTGDVRRILDLHIYPLLFPWGQREPLFPYFNAFIWTFMPKADGVLVNRLSSTLMDMGTCWGLYLLGRTVSNRVTGFLLMAFFAVSKPYIAYCFFGYGANTCVLSTVWMMVFFFRLLQKPVFRRFVYLGIALGFGAYTYVPARVWPPYLIGSVWLWLLYRNKDKSKTTENWILLIGVMLAWAFLFLSKNNLVESTWAWVAFFNNGFVAGAIAIALFVLYFRVGSKQKASQVHQEIFGWVTMVLITFLLSAPFLFNPMYANHLSDTSALHMNKSLSIGSEALKMIYDNTIFFFSMMFTQTTRDTGTYPTWVGSFFDYLPIVAMIVGLAYFVARPKWKSFFIVSLLLVGMLPFMLSNHTHSARALAVVGPLFIMAGLGINRLFQVFFKIPNIWLKAGVFGFFLLLWAWNAYWSNFEVWDHWMFHKSNDAAIFQQVDKDWRQNRLLVAPHYPEFESPAFTMLCDEKEVWGLNDPNPIYLESGETTKDVVVLFWGSDKKMEERLKTDFPEAQFSFVTGLYADRNQYLERVFIPAAMVTEDPSKLIYIVRVPHEYWRRKFYWAEYGIARGFMWWDDRVPTINSAFPAKLNVWESGEADGEINVKTEGTYNFAADSASDLIRLSVDGKEIMNFVPKDGVVTPPQANLHLTAGVHQVSYVTLFQHGPKFPNVFMLSSQGEKSSLGQ